jgi:hypothetical protein
MIVLMLAIMYEISDIFIHLWTVLSSYTLYSSLSMIFEVDVKL